MIKQAGIYAQNLTALVFKGLMLLFLASFTNIFTGCAEDNEPNETSPSNPDNHVTINADGTATGGAVFSPIDDTTFFLDYVKYEIVDAHLEIIGYDGNEISSEPKLYAEVKINGVTYKTRTLRDEIFWGCKTLKSITIPSTVTELGSNCFRNCENMQSIKLPDELERIGDRCFRDCSQLKSIVLPSKVTKLSEGCFAGCESLHSIKLPDELESIGSTCFSRCSQLESIVLPSKVTILGASCFYGCTSLQSIKIPDELYSIDSYCFNGCSQLKSIVLPSKVAYLWDYCFENCENLQSIELSDELVYIGTNCFRDCSQLRSVTFKNKVPDGTDPSLFNSCSNVTVYVPLPFLEDYKEAFRFSKVISEIVGY